MDKAEMQGQVEPYFGLNPGGEPKATKAATFGGGSYKLHADKPQTRDQRASQMI